MNANIAFIGGGNMATALIGGLVKDGFPGNSIAVADPDPAQLLRLSSTHGVRTSPEPDGALAGADVVVWAVKPQVLRSAAQSAAATARSALHVSVAAGVRLADLGRWLGTQRLVRAMPNTPALVGAGVTGLFAGGAVSDADRTLVVRILRSTGSVFWVGSDEAMDAVTAVSGSGPAYVFHFLEGLQHAAEMLGFPPAQARELALDVAHGAVQQARRSAEPFGSLRQRVTSKGGTTEAGLDKLNQHGTQQALIAAVQAAAARAGELGRELGQPRPQ